MKNFSSLLLICMAILFPACEEEAVPDTKAPDVLITSPADGTEFSQQEEITFEASVTDESELESVTVSITPPEGPAQEIHTADKESFTNGNREVRINRTFPLSQGGGLAEGNYTLTVHANDIHGNVKEEKVVIFIKKTETEGPSITILTPVEGAEFTTDKEIPLKVEVRDNSGLESANLTITPPAGDSPLIQSQAFGDRRTAANFDTRLNDHFSLAAGDYLIAVDAVDIFGNESKKQITITTKEPDTRAPTVEVNNPSEGMEFNTDDVISIEARATDNVELGSYTISLTPPEAETKVVHTNEFAANSTEGNIQETIRLKAGSPAGNYLIAIEVWDANENSTSERISITVKVPDAEAPNIAISRPTEGEEFTTDETIPVEARLTDNTGLASASIRITMPGGQEQELYTKTFAEEPAATTLTHTISLVDMNETGTYIIAVAATDKDGNTRDKKVNVVVREPDHSAPTVIISSPSAGMDFYANEEIPLQANATDNAVLKEVTVWISTPSGETTLLHTENPDNFFNDKTEALVEEPIYLGTDNTEAGTYVIRVRAVDVAGNTSEQKVNISILEADTSAPTISIHSPEAGSTYQHGDEVSLDAVVEDDRKLAKIRVTIMLENSVSMYDNTITDFDSDTRHQLLDTIAIPMDAPPGAYKVTVTASDAAGNTAVEERTFHLTAAD